MNFKLGKCLLILVTIVVSIVASGCFPDYGDFEDFEEYYNTFTDIHLLEDDLESHSYDMEEDFYNEELMTEGIEASMDLDYYSYLYFRVEKDITVKEMYLYLLGEESGVMVVELIHTGGIPVFARKYDSPTTEVDEETGEEKKIEYGDPVPLATTSCSIGSDWNSFGFNISEGLNITAGQYVTFRFKNNTGYGKDENLKKLKIATSLLSIRAE